MVKHRGFCIAADVVLNFDLLFGQSTLGRHPSPRRGVIYSTLGIASREFEKEVHSVRAVVPSSIESEYFAQALSMKPIVKDSSRCSFTAAECHQLQSACVSKDWDSCKTVATRVSAPPALWDSQRLARVKLED